MRIKHTSLFILGSAALIALTGCIEDTAKVTKLETEITTLKSQVEKAEADKKKAETELTALKSSAPTPPTQLADDKLKPAFEEAAKKYLEELKAYFTADKIASLLSSVPPASVTGLTASEVTTTPASTIVYTPPDKLRTFPYETSVKVTFQLTGAPASVIELPAKADSSGVWVFPTTQEVEARLHAALPRSAAAPATTTTTTTNTNSGGTPPTPPPTNNSSSSGSTTTTTTTTTPTNAPPIAPTSNAPSSGKAPRKGDAKQMDSH